MLFKLNRTKFFKYFVYTFLLSIVFLLGCNIEQTQKKHEELMEEFYTDKEGLYNLYLFGNDSPESKSIENDFHERWHAEDYLMVYNTRSYNISDPEYAPDSAVIDLLELSEDNTPVFFLFDNKGIVLKTDNFDDILDYLKEQK